MSRGARVAPAGLIYHVFNRSAGRFKMFRHEGDFDAFVRVMVAAYERFPIRILSFCVLADHWHFVVWPRHDGELSDFFRWLAHTHAMRWRVAHHTVGYGHLYADRFKSFAVQKDEHLQTVCRFVESRPLLDGSQARAEGWRWSSLWMRAEGTEEQKQMLCDWPLARPNDWVSRINAGMTEGELDQLKPSLERGRPFGDEKWQAQTAHRLGLEHTFRREGRPLKQPARL